MKYFMHNEFEISAKLENRIKMYFDNVDIITTEVKIKNKVYKAIVDIKSFLLPSNFDCFNCLTNCCIQFPYEFNRKSRKIILENLKEYDELTKAVSILKEEGLTELEIINSIKNDDMLIPQEHVKKTFDRCTCSCVHIDRSLCALHKICVDRGMEMKEIIDIKPLWCSIYPLEVILDEDNLLYIFVPNKKNDYLAMNDSEIPCMDIKMSKSPYFRRENPIGFKEEDYKPFIESYHSVLKYILGEKFVNDVENNLNLKKAKNQESQYNKKI